MSLCWAIDFRNHTEDFFFKDFISGGKMAVETAALSVFKKRYQDP